MSRVERVMKTKNMEIEIIKSVNLCHSFLNLMIKNTKNGTKISILNFFKVAYPLCIALIGTKKNR